MIVRYVTFLAIRKLTQVNAIGYMFSSSSWLQSVIQGMQALYQCYPVSCPDAKISVRIIYFNCLFFHRRPTHELCFIFCRPFVVNATFSTGLVVLDFVLSPDLGSLQLEFKSLIILIAGFQNFAFCLVQAVDLGVQINDDGRSLYIGSLSIMDIVFSIVFISCLS